MPATPDAKSEAGQTAGSGGASAAQGVEADQVRTMLRRVSEAMGEDTDLEGLIDELAPVQVREGPDPVVKTRPDRPGLLPGPDLEEALQAAVDSKFIRWESMDRWVVRAVFLGIVVMALLYFL